jgi:DNA-directed RNA polymerase subunit RPC12/RpoP
MSDLIRRETVIDMVIKALRSAANALETMGDVSALDGDLISRADAIEAVASITMSIHLSNVICDKLSALPSAEAVQGEWIRKEKEYNDCDGYRAYYWYECSECGARPPKNEWKQEWHSPYCPSCGARMYKGGDDE